MREGARAGSAGLKPPSLTVDLARNSAVFRRSIRIDAGFP